MKRRMRRLSVLVTPQTFWHLARIAKMAGFGDNLGRVIDKLVREKVMELRGEEGNHGG